MRLPRYLSHPLLCLIISLLFLISAHSAYADTADSLTQQLGLPTNTLQSSPNPLPADQAFQLKTDSLPGKVILNFNIAPGYALYQNRFAFKTSGDAQVGTVNFPTGTEKIDPVFGKQIEYENQLILIIPILGPANHAASLNITYQGCSAQLCYPLLHQIISLTPNPTSNINTASKPFWIAIPTLFILGILLAFTPCLWPLYPILSSIILGQHEKTWASSLKFSFSYVFGMACSYAALGWLITRIGASFQADLQQPWVILILAMILILMGLSMFGLFTLQLPRWIRHGVSVADQKLKGGSVFSVFIMGALSLLIISPCASAPLIGILSLMIQTGNTLLGAFSLFILALGMGVPLMLISLGLGKFLPKTGPWMQRVRRFIGGLMILIAIYLIIRMIPMPWLERSSIRVTSLPALESSLRTAHPPILLDFYASWCLECRGLANTLDDPALEPYLKNGTVIQINLSQDTPDTRELITQYHILGLPTLILLNNQKQEASRFIGTISVQQLQEALSHS